MSRGKTTVFAGTKLCVVSKDNLCYISMLVACRKMVVLSSSKVVLRLSG